MYAGGNKSSSRVSPFVVLRHGALAALRRKALKFDFVNVSVHHMLDTSFLVFAVCGVYSEYGVLYSEYNSSCITAIMYKYSTVSSGGVQDSR
jgi:hypothetical protein